MTEIVFIEDQLQALEASQILKSNPDTILIALTADATYALEQMELPHKSAFEYANLHGLASAERQYTLDCINILAQIESFLTQRYTLAILDGPGFLTGQDYYVQYSIGSIVARAYLMWWAVQRYSPSSVIVFHEGITPWYADGEYEINPWLQVFIAMCNESEIPFRLIPLIKPNTNIQSSKIKDFYYRFRKYLIVWIEEVVSYWRNSPIPKRQNKNTSFRLLLANAQLYDWSSVLDKIKKNKSFSLYYLISTPVSDKPWTYYFDASVYIGLVWNRQALDVDPPCFDIGERNTLSALLDQWVVENPEMAKLNVLGMEIFPALLPYLRSMISTSLPLARYANELALKVLDTVSPHAVCVCPTSLYAAKALAYHARQKDIPVVSYQHGGAYGTQMVFRHSLTEYADVDYFLTYGHGIQPSTNPVKLEHAQFIPVGSARIENMLDNMDVKKFKPDINILWIAELSTRNTIFGESQVEDTLRYHLQKQSLGILGARALNVVYRPFPGDEYAQVTPRWIRQAGFPAISVDTTRSLEKLIKESDVVICDSSSSTTWNEVLALGKPLIVYCDPQQTILMEHFAKDLEQACYWCKSVPELIAAINRLAKDPRLFIAELSQLRTEEYLRKYVLHDGHSVENVVTFLSEVCGKEGKHG